jgi:hypothetical protein
MPLETGSYIADLVSTNPAGTDQRRQGDDHLRLVKSVLLTSFPNIDGAVTATPAELNKTADPTNFFPSGGIIMWSGLIANIPAGWALCNGTGTAGGVAIPDLRNRFIIGADSDAGGTDDVNDTGGSRDIVGLNATTGSTVLNIDNLPAHQHQSPKNQGGGGGNNSPFGTGSVVSAIYNGHPSGSNSAGPMTSSVGSGIGHTHTIGTPTAGANLPSYYALAYIIKL